MQMMIHGVSLHFFLVFRLILPQFNSKSIDVFSIQNDTPYNVGKNG